MINTPEEIKTFMLAGNAYFTVTSKATGNRFTFRVAKGKKEGAPHFASVLTGPDNTNDYTFLGSIFNGSDYRHGKRSPISQDAPSAKAFTWFQKMIAGGKLPESVDFHHMGRCGRCARPLTVPESVESGFGPECIHKIFGG